MDDYLAGLAQLKWLPLRARIVLLLEAMGADKAPVFVSEEDLRRMLAASSKRYLTQEIAALVKARALERLRGEGSRPNLYALRPPEEWLEPGWIGSRKDALDRIALCRARTAGREARLWTGRAWVKDPFCAQAGPGRRTRLMPRPGLGTNETSRPGPAWAQNEPAPEGSTVSLVITPPSSSLDEDDDGEIAARNRARTAQLLAALGSDGAHFIGEPRKRLAHIAAEANGRLPELVELARSIATSGVRSPSARVDLLEDALVRPTPAAATAPADCSACGLPWQLMPCRRDECPGRSE